MANPESGTPSGRLIARVRGEVQGVGFRAWVRRQAEPLGLVGTARNLPDGRVEVVAEGPRDACQQLLDRLRGSRTPGEVDDVDEQWGEAEGGFDGFRES